MKYSLVNGERSEAQPGLSGQCPACENAAISKCGKLKIWHWAHKGQRKCDPWWENETEWHRAWKGQFPKECQEVIKYAKNGEKHIADVKTAQGWVLEFQHSFLKEEERKARNEFYKKLVWVVDGLRCKRHKPQFFRLLNESRPMTTLPQMRQIYLDESALSKEWSGIDASVFFDFGEEILWCLLPFSQNTWGYVVPFSRREFVEIHNKGAEQTRDFEDWLNKLNYLINPAPQKPIQAPVRSVLQYSCPLTLARRRRVGFRGLR
jgi:hypothetical protein